MYVYVWTSVGGGVNLCHCGDVTVMQCWLLKVSMWWQNFDMAGTEAVYDLLRERAQKFATSGACLVCWDTYLVVSFVGCRIPTHPL